MKKLLLFVIACTLGLFGTVNAQVETAADSVVLAAPVVVVDTTTATTVTLVWNVVENATSYNVYSDTLVANVIDTVYTVEGLTAETVYTFTVKALADTLESAASEAVTAKTLAAEPTEPGDGEEGEGDEPTEPGDGEEGEGNEPTEPETPEFNGYRLESVETSWGATVYEFDETNKVVAVDEDGLITKVTYNEAGQIESAIASYEDGVDSLDNPIVVVLSAVEYAYDTNGTWVSYAETAADMWGQTVTTETVLGYDEAGKLVSLTSEEMVSTIAYNEAGLVSEVVVGYIVASEVEDDEEIEEGEDDGIALLSEEETEEDVEEETEEDVEEETATILYDSKVTFEYENGRLVKKNYYSYDSWELNAFYLAEAEIYEYDTLGNCVSKKAYLAETEDEAGNLTLNSFPYSVTEYIYDLAINNEDVYSFEYPHFAFMNWVEPSYVNILAKELSYYSYYDDELEEIVSHSYEATVYNYNPEVLTSPLTPMNLTAEVTSATEIELAWAAFADAESFIIYSADTVYAEGVEESPYTVDGLELGAEYCFTVVAVNTVDTSAASNVACAKIELPAAPTKLVAKATSDTTIDLSWETVENIWEYNVYSVVEGDTTSTYELLGTAWWGMYTVEGLTADTEYSFVVKSVSVVGESEASNVATAKTNEEGVEILLSEDFENYEVGAKIAETNPEYWTTWNDKPGTKEDGVVAAEEDGNQYGHMTHGVDQVLLLGGYKAGVFELEFDIYIPENKGAYYNILHDFNGGYSTWALQAYLQMTDDGQGNPTISAGHSAVHAGGSNAADIPTVWNGWMHFRIVIDANTDMAEYYYTMPNGEETKACEWQWSKDSFGEGVVNRKLDAMNFFPPNNKSEFYIDNLLLKRIGGEAVVSLAFDKEKVEASKAANDITIVDFTVENTGEAVVDYAAWVDYGMGEMSDKYEMVSYALEDLSTTTAIGWSSTTEPMTFEIAALYPASAYGNSVMGTYITDAAYLLPEFKTEEGETVPMIEPGTDMIFRIYEQGINGYPGKVLAEKVIPADSIILDYNVVTFDEPVALTGFDFYFAVEMTQCVGGAPMVLDGNTDASLKGYADLCRLSNTSAFVSLTEYASGESFGNWHLAIICTGNPVTGGWAELSKNEGTLAIGANETINVNISTFGLKPGATYEATIVFSTSSNDENIELPLSLYIWGEDVEEILSNTYNIYPNPTTAQVTVEGENINYIAVYNSVGQLVKVVRTQNNVVDMSANENGVYFFNIVDNAGQSSVQRVVVAK